MKKQKVTFVILSVLEVLLLAAFIVLLVIPGDSAKQTIAFADIICIGLVAFNLKRTYTTMAYGYPLAMYERVNAVMLRGVYDKKRSYRKRLLRAIARGKCGNLKKAERIFASLIAKLSGEDERTQCAVYYFLGAARESAGALPGAIEAYLRAEEFDRAPANVYSNLGVVYMKTGDYDKAEEQLLTAVERDGRSFIFSSNLANLYILKKNASRAREFAEKAIAASADYLPPRVTLIYAAALERRRSEMERCITAYKQMGGEEEQVRAVADRLIRGDLSALDLR